MCKNGQNKIDYIVLHKPNEAAKLLEKHGYQAPKNKEDLPRAVKVLVKRKGEEAIKDLIRIHPERDIILEVTGHKSGEDNYCGCSSSYTGETKDLLDKLSGLSIADLEQLYQDAKRNAKDKPEDKSLPGQVELIWDELNRRKKQGEKKSRVPSDLTQNLTLTIAVAFLLGVVVGKMF